jgi:hypothetical protein
MAVLRAIAEPLPQRGQTVNDERRRVLSKLRLEPWPLIAFPSAQDPVALRSEIAHTGSFEQGLSAPACIEQAANL